MDDEYEPNLFELNMNTEENTEVNSRIKANFG